MFCCLLKLTLSMLVHSLLHCRHLLSFISLSLDLGQRVASAGSASPSHHSSSPVTNHTTSNITISHVNINSITSRCRLDELSYFASLQGIDILCLTETKLDDSIHPSLFSLDCYHTPLTRHRNRSRGGVAIYVRNNLAVKRLPNLEISLV